MKHSKITFITLILIILSSSCNLIPSKKEDKAETKQKGVIVHKNYYENGSLKSEITVKNNKKNGPAKKYYITGELHTVVHYVDNVKEGETIWYYKNGQPYRVTNYIHDEIQGLRKIYYENGKLQAEIPYKDDNLIEGTKEYNKYGKLLTDIPHIKFSTIDLMKSENKYIIQVYLSNNSKNATFYSEVINTAKKKSKLIVETKDGIGSIIVFMPPGSYKTKTLKFYAEYKSSLGNPFLLSATYNLDIEN